MPVTLAFEVDKEGIERDQQLKPEQCDAGQWLQVFFWMPVRLTVDDVLVWESNTGIYYVALSIMHLKKLQAGQTYGLEPPGGGWIAFHRLGDLVRVTTSRPREPVAVEVGYADLIRAWETFNESVRSFLAEEFPDAMSSPEVGWFLRGEDPPAYGPYGRPWASCSPMVVAVCLGALGMFALLVWLTSRLLR